MKLPLQITAHNLEMTDAIEAAVKKKAEKLDQFSDRITSCKVVVECPHRHHKKGVMYNIHIDISVPGAELIVKREPNIDLYVALRDAFDAARRQLLEYKDRQSGHVKNHEQLPEEGMEPEAYPEQA